MFDIIIGSFLAVLIWAAYRYYYQPKKLYQKYSKLFKSLGYRVYELPFHPFKVGFVSQWKKGVQLHGDAHYEEKITYQGYDLVLSNAFNMITIMLLNPNLIKEFVTPEKVWIYPKLKMLTNGMKEMAGEGIGFSQGNIWKRKRKIISKLFSFDLIKANVDKISILGDKTIKELESSHLQTGNMFEYYVLDIGTSLFSRVIMRCFLGCDEVPDRVDGLKFQQFGIKLFLQINELRLSPLVLIFGDKAFKYGISSQIRKVKEKIQIFKTIIRKMIEIRIQKIMKEQRKDRYTDIIEAFIRESEIQTEQDSKYTTEDIVEEFFTFFIAGTDTTAHFFMMTLYYICDHPEIEQRLRKEVDSLIKSDDDYTFENLKKLTYIDWIQNETTRMYGPGTAILIREASVDNYIGNIPIFKGTGVNFGTVCNHYDERNFKDPHTFRPERWESECNNLHPFAFLGFSAGPKSCMGKQLAYLESKIILIKLLKRYERFELPPGKRKMVRRFMYEPESFKTKFFKKEAESPEGI